MFVKLIDEVKFLFKALEDHKGYRVKHGEGRLYLSEEGILVSEEGSWYQLPLDMIYDINRIEGEHPGLEFKIPGMDVIVRGTRKEFLWALRHFLLPTVRSN